MVDPLWGKKRTNDTKDSFSKNPECYCCAGLRVCQGMMVLGELEPAGCGHGVQLVVWEAPAKVFSRGAERIVEFIVRIVHLIAAENGFQASFIESGIVRDQRQSLDEWFYPCPYAWKYRSIVGVVVTKAMYLLAEPLVVVRLWLYQRIEPVYHFPTSHNHYAD